MKVSENDRDQEDVYERDFKEEKPAQSHQLVPAKSRQGPADPHHEKNKRANLGEKNGDVDQAEDPAVRSVRDSRKMPAAKEKSGDDSRAGDHGDVFAEKE